VHSSTLMDSATQGTSRERDPDSARLASLDAELTRLRAALAESREQYRRCVQRTDQFLTVLGHELRNPLAPMTNALQILRQRGPHAPEVHWAREVIAHQVQQMDRVIEDLLDLSHMQNGGVDLHMERFRLLEAVDRAVASMRVYLERFGHHLTVNLPPQNVQLYGDLRRVAHMIGHLLSNAAKFTHAGGNIWVTAQPHDDHVEISVRDSGSGIAPERLVTLFQPYREIDQVRRTEGGLGVGLSLVKHLAELHGGTVEAKSAGLGRGAEFILRLPTVREEHSGEANGLDPLYSPTRRTRVLVVDDNRLAADSLTVLLQEAGYESCTVYEGNEAVHRAETFRPDVILLDLGLPQQSGTDICEKVRKEPWGEEILIVAVTGWGQAEVRDQSFASGFDDHLVKPVHPERLMRIIVDHQKRRGKRRKV
jgi:signal transduction histidine kinase/ActR/RegA family two-component response regulator